MHLRSHMAYAPQNICLQVLKIRKIQSNHIIIIIFDNDFTFIIDIYFYETLSTPTQSKALALHSLDTLSDVR